MREQRRIEQSHNPNYLKSKTTKRNKTDELKDNLNDIPIQEIQLDVPIQITCKCMNEFHNSVNVYTSFPSFFQISNQTLGQISR